MKKLSSLSESLVEVSYSIANGHCIGKSRALAEYSEAGPLQRCMTATILKGFSIRDRQRSRAY